MKRKIKFFLFGFVFFLCFLLVVPFLLPTKIYQELLVSHVESSFPVHVEMGKMRLRFFPVPGALLKDVKIFSAEAPFESKPLATAADLQVSVSLRPILNRKMVLSFQLGKPVIYFRTKGNVSNFQTIFASRQPAEKKDQFWFWQIDSLNLKQGTLNIWDDDHQQLIHHLDQIDGTLSNLSFSGSGKIRSKELKLWGESIENAEIAFHLNLPKLQLDSVSGTVMGGAFSGDGFFLFKKPVSWHFDLRWNHVPFENLVFLKKSFRGIGSLHTLINGKENDFSATGVVESKELFLQETSLRDLHVDFELRPQTLYIRSFKSAMFDAPLQGSGTLSFGDTTDYHFDTVFQDVQLEKLPFLKKIILGNGTLHAKIAGKWKSDEEWFRHFDATGDIQVTNGSVPSLHLGREIFDHSVWQNMSPLAGFDREELRSLQNLDSAVQQLSIPFEIVNGKTTVKEGTWNNPRYQIAVHGSIGLDQALDGAGAFLLLPGEVNKLVKDKAVRDALVDANGELELPFFIGGTLSTPQITPDKATITPRFTKAVLMRGVQLLNPENVVQEPIKILSAPVKIFNKIFK